MFILLLILIAPFLLLTLFNFLVDRFLLPRRYSKREWKFRQNLAATIPPYFKLCWMVTWRLLPLLYFQFSNDRVSLSGIIGFATIFAAVMVFGFNRSIASFPIIKLFRKEQILFKVNKWGAGLFTVWSDKRAKDAPIPPELKAHIDTLRHREPTGQARTDGIMTGYEPAVLESVPIPNGAYMVGRPGAGLTVGSTGFDQARISAGVAGEVNFAKALALYGLIDRFQTIWSSRVPDAAELAEANHKADLDCVIPTNQGLVLIDLKLYKSGNVRYYSDNLTLFTEDASTGDLVAKHTLSPNMRNATWAIKNHFPTVAVLPFVVFMPTDRGAGQLVNVHWPGAVPATALSDFLAWLSTLGPATPSSGVQLAANELIRIQRSREMRPGYSRPPQPGEAAPGSQASF